MLPLELQAARVQALSRWPYLASAFTALCFVERQNSGTFSVDPYYRLYYDPAVCQKWSVPMIAGVLYHEVNHLLRRHAHRRQERDPQLWNLAGDCAINDDLCNEGVVLPEGMILPSTFGLALHQLEEVYYNELLKKGELRKGADGVACGQCGSGASGQPEPGDAGPSSEEKPGLSTGESEIIAYTVAKAIKDIGNVPYRWRRWADEKISGRLDWRRGLAGAVRRTIAAQRGMVNYTYQRPSRRQSACPTILLPSFYAPIPTVALVIDTSGSIDEQTLATAKAQVDAVIQGCGCQSLTVFDVDAEVHSRQQVSRAKQVKLVGGGGTDMGKGILAAMKMRPRPQVVIILTDGYTPWPEKKPPFSVVVGLVGREVNSDIPWWTRKVRIGE